MLVRQSEMKYKQLVAQHIFITARLFPEAVKPKCSFCVDDFGSGVMVLLMSKVFPTGWIGCRWNEDETRMGKRVRE